MVNGIERDTKYVYWVKSEMMFKFQEEENGKRSVTEERFHFHPNYYENLLTSLFCINFAQIYSTGKFALKGSLT